MRIFSFSFAIAVTFTAHTLSCMQPIGVGRSLFIDELFSLLQAKEIEEKENAGDLGSLPTELVQEIATYCEPKDRCAMRCTGRHLNTNLQCFKQDDQNFLIAKRNKHREHFNTTLKGYSQRLAWGTEIIGKLCQKADQIAAIAIVLDDLVSPFFIKEKSHYNPLWHLQPPLEASLGNAMCHSAVEGTVKGYIVNVMFAWISGPCFVLLRRPAAYCWGLATHLFYRKKIAQEARQSFYSKEDYIHSDWNFEKKLRKYQQEKNCRRLARIQQQSFLMHKIHQIKEWFNPSVNSLYNYNLDRARLRVHSTICRALPSLPVKHDE